MDKKVVWAFLGFFLINMFFFQNCGRAVNTNSQSAISAHGINPSSVAADPNGSPTPTPTPTPTPVPVKEIISTFYGPELCFDVDTSSANFFLIFNPCVGTQNTLQAYIFEPVSPGSAEFRMKSQVDPTACIKTAPGGWYLRATCDTQDEFIFTLVTNVDNSVSILSKKTATLICIDPVNYRIGDFASCPANRISFELRGL